jgi:cupin 2 domain-containing protein
VETGNLFVGLPAVLPQEISNALLNAGASRVRIERIVSDGNCSPPGFWYDQQDNEWVVLLKGAARLRFEAGDRTLALSPGDHVTIAAHEKHRVDWTSDKEQTVWLAVFF